MKKPEISIKEVIIVGISLLIVAVLSMTFSYANKTKNSYKNGEYLKYDDGNLTRQVDKYFMSFQVQGTPGPGSSTLWTKDNIYRDPEVELSRDEIKRIISD
ncbi:hypothetical protein ACFLUV_06945 [Elusimicrobiota bacterium]